MHAARTAEAAVTAPTQERSDRAELRFASETPESTTPTNKRNSGIPQAGTVDSTRRLSSPFRHGPLRTNDDVEWITAGCVKWYNARRLYSTLGDTPPDEFEAAYYAGLGTPSHPVLAPA